MRGGWWVVGGGYSYRAILFVILLGENNISITIITIKQQQRRWFIKTLQLNGKVKSGGERYELTLTGLQLDI